MKKHTVTKFLMLLLPVLAVVLAAGDSSVTVFRAAEGITEYYSYFEPVPVENLQMLPPMAATLSFVSGILAAVWAVRRNPGIGKASGYTAFGAAVAACIPIVVRGETLVIPNVALPICMMCQFLTANYAAKLPQETGKKDKSPRLKAR